MRMSQRTCERSADIVAFVWARIQISVRVHQHEWTGPLRRTKVDVCSLIVVVAGLMDGVFFVHCLAERFPLRRDW